MEAQKNRILTILRPCKGNDKAITARALSRKLHVPEREVRGIISDLVINERALIGSSVRRPYGFYMIKTACEWKENIKRCGSREKANRDRKLSLYQSGKSRFSKKIQGEFNFNG